MKNDTKCKVIPLQNARIKREIDEFKASLISDIAAWLQTKSLQDVFEIYEATNPNKRNA